jgi:hypothetical protein
MKSIGDLLQELRPEFEIGRAKDFARDGYLDSFDVISLVTMLEENYGILIDALDIVPSSFASVETIAEVVRKNGGKV